jgi:hypothetical protein
MSQYDQTTHLVTGTTLSGGTLLTLNLNDGTGTDPQKAMGKPAVYITPGTVGLFGDTDETMGIDSGRGGTPSKSALTFLNNSSIRWQLYKDESTETGGNSGQNLYLTRYADNGAWIGNLLQFNRANGFTIFYGNVGFGGAWPGKPVDVTGSVRASVGYEVGTAVGVTKTCSAMPTAMTIVGGIITAITGGTCTP